MQCTRTKTLVCSIYELNSVTSSCRRDIPVFDSTCFKSIYSKKFLSHKLIHINLQVILDNKANSLNKILTNQEQSL